ncbi:MAG: hypothetical protein HYZ28_18450 [Myxococcales bacterium]|nr:hypothetical protein [Myxococcales bacterium]
MRVLLVTLAFCCGRTEPLAGPPAAATSGPTNPAAVKDAGAAPGPGCRRAAPPDGGCRDASVAVATMQSCSFEVLAGFEVDAEAFIEADAGCGRVLALKRWGGGHLLAYCDSTSLGTLWRAAPIDRYLAQRERPRIASIGDGFPCNPDGSKFGYPILPATITYLGEDLPDRYRADAGALATDWDAIVFCGARRSIWNAKLADTSAELSAYVIEHGAGLAVVLDYYLSGADPDFQLADRLLGPAGLRLERVSLGYDTARLESCVPDWPP